MRVARVLAFVLSGAIVAVPTTVTHAEMHFYVADPVTVLGGLLAAEEPCDLNYNADAIRSFVDQNVEEDDAGFPSKLDAQVLTRRAAIENLTPSTLTAYCAQVVRVTRAYGLVR